MPLLNDIREHHTDTTVSFSLKFAGGAKALSEHEEAGTLHKTLKLSSSLATTNMTLFDAHGRIMKHESPEDILTSFYSLRLDYYQKRKNYLSDQLTSQWSKLDNRVRFVLAVINNKLKISNVKKDILIATLQKEGYAQFEPPSKKKKSEDGEEDDDDDEKEAKDEKEAAKKATSRGYDYLLGMPLWSLTLEKVEQLKKELAEKEAELKKLLATTPKEMWSVDLDAFLVGYEQWEAELAAAEAGVPKPKGGNGGKAKAAPKKSKKKADDDDDDFMDDDDDDWDEGKKKKKAAAKKAAKEDKNAPPAPPSLADAVAIAVPVPGAKPQAAPKRKTYSEDVTPQISDDEDEGDAISIKAVLAAAAAVKKGAVPKPKAPPVATIKEDSDSDDDDSAGMSLMARLAAKANNPAAAKPASSFVSSSPVAKPIVKRPCAKESPKMANVDDVDMEDGGMVPNEGFDNGVQGGDFANMKIPELKEKCREMGLAVGGNHGALVDRLNEATGADLHELKKEDLKERCRKNGLAVGGNNDELIARLKEIIKKPSAGGSQEEEWQAPEEEAAPEEAPEEEGDDLSKLKIPELKEKCREMGLAVGGNHGALVDRLKEAMSGGGAPSAAAKPAPRKAAAKKIQVSDDEDSDEDEDEEEEEDSEEEDYSEMDDDSDEE